MPEKSNILQAGTVLVIDDEEGHAEAVAEGLERRGYKVITATSGNEGLEKVERGGIDIVVTDLVMNDVDGMEILDTARRHLDHVEVIVVTGHATVETAVEAMRKGAYTYLRKPVDMRELRTVVANALERLNLRRSNLEMRQRLSEKFGFDGIIGSNPQMLKMIDTLRRIAPTNATVLIYGESGTGKDIIAKAIHTNSPRRDAAFVALNCAALSESILESELFGHEKGAFTGADSLRKGRFEYADKGSLFLDELGDMPMSTQVKLLRVIEEREIYRVGSNVPIKVDVRLIAATNADLEKLVDEKKFRQDLFFRLNVVTVHIPTLRDRRGDIPLLTDAFIREFSSRHGRRITAITPEVQRILSRHPWEGNVRELKNCIESMVVVTSDSILGVDDLPAIMMPTVEAAPLQTGKLSGLTLEEAERLLITNALDETGGNRAEAARALDIGERTLYRKIKQYGLS